MEHNSNLDELLISYLLKESSAEQQDLIIEWIGKDEKNRNYFEEFRKMNGLIAAKRSFDNINVEDEWRHFENEVARLQVQPPLTTVNEERRIDHLSSEEPGRRSRMYRIMMATAVAASLLLLIGLGWRMFFNQGPVEQPTSSYADQKPGISLPVMRHEVNTLDKPRKLVLQDGSEVILEAKSELSFFEPFEPNCREVTLIGMANFKVAKNKAKPFTVFSGDLRTTVLGTEFSVTAYNNAGKITIRLYEGKVVVRSIEEVKKKLKKDYYLIPGNELVYYAAKGTALIRNFNLNKSIVERPEIKKNKQPLGDNPLLPLNNKESWYMFNNQLVSQVFDQLEAMYDVKIEYKAKDVERLYFIGTFNKSDSVENVLKQITQLNNLKMTRKDNKYIISK